MKHPLKSLIITIVLTTSALAADNHGGHDKEIPGPNGGRIVEIQNGHAEFVVGADKKVTVRFFDDDMKPVEPNAQIVEVIAEAPSGRMKLDFEKTTDAFVSKGALPEGDGYRIVLQIRPEESGKVQNSRIDYHTEVCGTCKRAEYACICSNDEKGGGHGH